MFELTDSQKIGALLAGFGVFFLFLGMLLFFDGALLAMGNILFLSGVALIIGLASTFRFFFQRHKIKGSGCFFGGVLLVLLGYSMIGMIIECIGFVFLFGSFFSIIINFLRRMPVIGAIFSVPFVSQAADRVSNMSAKLPV